MVDSATAAPLSDALISLLDTTANLMGLHRTNNRGHASSYISILESVGRRDFIVTRFGKECITPT